MVPFVDLGIQLFVTRFAEDKERMRANFGHSRTRTQSNNNGILVAQVGLSHRSMLSRELQLAYHQVRQYRSPLIDTE
jgi:hypothetical protein